jgi:PKD repeat protein
LADDPAGQMTQGENTVIAGSGSQTSTYYRWGDYSMMSVDPVDDCTFWYTNEYMTTTGNAPWRSRVASFQLGSCTAADTPPTVSITNPADGAAVSGTVSVTATATDDNGVTQVEFFVDGGSIGGDTNAGDGWSTSWDTTAYADGAHTITATATDSIGQTGADTISITLDNINELPVADFTYSCSDLICSFDGSGSTDPDGTIDSYAWNFGDGATGSGATASHTYAAAGTYSAVLTVTDNRGGTDSDTQDVIATTGPTTLHVGDLDGASTSGSRGRWNAGVTITVLDADEGPVANASVSGTWSAGATGGASCTTDGSGRCAVEKNNIKSNVTSVTFTVGDVTHASLVYDAGSNDDPDGDSNGTVIVVYQNGPPANQPPTASFTFSCRELSCDFDGSGSSDPDGSIVAYDWDFGDNQAGSGATTSHTYATSNTYTVVLTVTDDGGATDASSQAVPVGTTLPTMHVADMVGNGAPGSRGRWTATVTITVRDSTDTAVANATVSGSWGGGASGSASCSTDNNGNCDVTKTNIKSNVASITFTVTDVTSTQYTYDAGGNHVTTITVQAP